MSSKLIRFIFFAALVSIFVNTDSTYALYRNSDFSATLENTRGDGLLTYFYGGKVYALGEYGERYNIRVYNHTGRRVEAVVTVDGRDVVSGNVGDYTTERGYIVGPYGTVLIEGFRQNYSNVAAFRFTDPGNNYSSRMGTPQNVGVIGVSLFPEKYHVYRRYPVPPQAPSSTPRSGESEGGRADDSNARGSLSGAAPSAKSEARSRGTGCTICDSHDSNLGNRNNIGTEYAEDHYSPVREVTFERESRTRPAQLLVIYYDDREGLSARGIPVEPSNYRVHTPDPFPKSHFAPPPP